MVRAVLILAFVFSVTCVAAPAPAQDAKQFAPKEVSFRTSDGGQVFAWLYGEGEHAVVMARGAVFNKESWAVQSKLLAEQGLQVLAIDFRGYGKSKPGTKGNALHLDCLLYTSPSPRDATLSRMPSSA